MREAIVRIDDAEFDAMGVGELIRLVDSAGLREFEELECRGTGALVRVETDAAIEDESFEGVDCVDRWESLGEEGGVHRYLVEFTAPDLPEELRGTADDLVGTCDPSVGENGTTLSLVGEQADISDTIQQYQTAGVTPDLRTLGGYDGPDRPLDALTDRQREVIRTAFEMGYFEVPRPVSTDDVAAELDLDSSTVAEHLQRAERNLLSEVLDVQE